MKSCRRFLIIIFLSLLPMGGFATPEKADAQASEASEQGIKEATVSIDSLENRFAELQKDNVQNSLTVQYSKMSELWEQVATELKVHFDRREQIVEGGEVDNFDQWQKGVAERFRLLRKVSFQRGRILRKLEEQGHPILRSDDRAFSRIGLEISLIPYKFLSYFYERWNWVQTQLTAGFWGFLKVLSQLFFLFLIALVPFVFFRLSKITEDAIERQKRSSFYKSFNSQRHRSLTVILSVVSEYLPWILFLFAINLVEILLWASEFGEITNFTVYLRYYVYYKFFRITLELAFREVASKINIEAKDDINQKIKSTSRFLGLVLLILYSLKAAFFDAIGESLIFTVSEPFFGWLVLFLLFYVSSRWENEIEKYLKDTGIVWLQGFAARLEKSYSFFISLPALILLIVHFLVEKVLSWGSRFDFVKLLYAKILRVKYESQKNESIHLDPVDPQYINDFYAESEKELKNFFLKTETFQQVYKQLELWNEGVSTEQTVAIFGQKGSGKTSLLNECKKDFESKGYECLFLSVNSKVFTENSFEQFLSPVLDLDGDKKTVVFIDDAHNLFLSTIGGFKTFQSFLEKMEELKNIFWIVSFGEFAWLFLNDVLGNNQYFRIEKRVPRWSNDQIKDLILATHSRLGRSILYDQIFRSSQRLDEGVTSSESRFFYLIWEKSHGIPGLAISYWLRSLRRLSENRLKVCLPSDNPVQELLTLNQEMHFVYAALMKHENLNISEASMATNLPKAFVKQALYRGVEEGFLCEEAGRFRVTMGWFDDVKKFLKGKNLIYEYQ